MTPLEPLRTLAVAAEMIPFVNVGALRDWLDKHRREFPPRYMPIARRDRRMLSDSEIARIRQMRVKNSLRPRNPAAPQGRSPKPV